MSSISAGLVKTTNLTVSGLGAGAVQATNLNFTNLDVSGNLSVGGAIKVDVKDTTVELTNSVFSDMMATTQAGRVALAKALDFGIQKPIYEINGYLPLLEAGYSGKGVYYAHMEDGNLYFSVPPFRHIVNPKYLSPTNPAIFDSFENSEYKLNGVAVHQHGMCGFAVGFDLHAKLINGSFGLIADGNWTSYNPDAFYMGAGYNADVASGGITFLDYTTLVEDPAQPPLTDDMWVEVMEKAFRNGAKVSSASLGFNTSYNTDYYQIDNSGNPFDGIDNPMTYIYSLAADHNLVVCNGAGNWSYSYLSVVPSPGSGRMPIAPTDARNILSVGSNLVNDGTVYNEIYDSSKIYARVNYYKNPTTGAYSLDPGDGFTERELGSYNGFGRTVDTTGPGETHRLKPDIISAVGGANHYVYWPSQAPSENNTVYGRVRGPPTSATSPTIAGGVCLLREALRLYDAHQIRECILKSGSNANLSDPDTELGLGYGLINLAAALAYGQARTYKYPPTFEIGDWEYSETFLTSIADGAMDTLNVYQPFDVDYNFVPKSVQSFKCPKDIDLSANSVYQDAYADYEVLYDEYVALAPSLWSGAVLDLSPAKGLWGTNPLRMMNSLEGGDGPTFKVVSNRSWISVSKQDMQEIKDLMISNGIKVKVTSATLGAFSVLADSPEQLASVVNGNFKIRHVTPVQRLVSDRGMLAEDREFNSV